MCRLMAVIGHSPMLLADVVLWPDRSIIKQSYDARERKGDPSLPFHLRHGNLNGDGFGIGWFSNDERREVDPTPCVFTSITPAWNNENLARLATKIVSPLMFAHVRAAYPGMPVSEQNCHPFMWGRYLWMHNGVVGGFAQIKRSVLELLSDAAYNSIQSFHSDSAVSFALFLHHLPNLTSQHPPDVLLQAMQDTISCIQRIQHKHGVTATSLLNFVVSDGSSLVATRFVSPETADAASLYYAEGADFVRSQEASPLCDSASGTNGNGAACNAPAAANGTCNSASATMCAASRHPSSSSVLHEASYELEFGQRGTLVAFVASEPITASSTDWVAVPKNTALVITREKGGFLNVMRSPLVPLVPPGQAIAVAPASSAAAAVLQQAQREVSVCLEAINRGLSAKARAWVARTGSNRDTGLPQSVLHLSGPPTAPPTPPPEPEDCAAWTQQQQPSLLQHHAPPALLALPGAGGAGSPGNMPVLGSPHTLAQQSASMMRIDSAVSGLSLALSRVTSQGELTPTTPSSPMDPSIPPANGIAIGPSVLSPRTGAAAAANHHEPAAHAVNGAADPNGGGHGDEHEHLRLVGHSGAVMCSILDDAKTRLYSASVDCTIRVWDLSDNSCVGTIVAGKKPVTHMQLCGRWLCSSGGRKLRVWDTVSLHCVYAIRISNNCGNVRCFYATMTRLFLGCQDATVKAFVVDEHKWQDVLKSGQTVPPDNPAVGGEDPVPAREADYVTGPGGHVAAVNALTAIGGYIASAAGDATIRIWSAADLSLVRTLRGHRGSVLCLLALDNVLVSGARDNTIRVWDMDMDWMCRRTLAGHKDDVTSLSAVTLRHPFATPDCDGGANASGSSPSQGPPPRRSYPGFGAVAGAAVPGAGGEGSKPQQCCCTVIASSSADGTVRLWSSLTWSCMSLMALPSAASPTAQPPLHLPAGRAAGMGSGFAKGAWSGAAAGAMGQGGSSVAAGRGVPAALCSVLTSSAVVAGYSDGELRMWHCEDVQLAVLKQAAAELGMLLMSPGSHWGASATAAAGRAAGLRAEGWPVSGLSYAATPGMLSPGTLTPPEPAGLGSHVDNHHGGSPRLSQANVKEVLQLLSARQQQQQPGGGAFGDSSTGSQVLATLSATPDVAAAQAAASALLAPSMPAPVITKARPEPVPIPLLVHSPHTMVPGAEASFSSDASDGGSCAQQQPGGDPLPDAEQVDLSPARQQQQQQQQQQLLRLQSGDRQLSLGDSSAGNHHTGSPLHAFGSFMDVSGPAPMAQALAAAKQRYEQAQAAQQGGSGAEQQQQQQLAAAPLAVPGQCDDSDEAQPSSLHSHPLSEAARRPTVVSDPVTLGRGSYASNGASSAAASPPGSLNGESLLAATIRDLVKLSGSPQATPAFMRPPGAGPDHGQAQPAADAAAAPALISPFSSAPPSAPQTGAAVSLLTHGLQQAQQAHQLQPHAARVPAPSSTASLSDALANRQQLERRLTGTTMLVSGIMTPVCGGSTDMQMERCLREFVRIRTVSSNPKLREDCVKGAKFLAKLLESLGADVKVVRPFEDKNPVIIGRLGRNPAKPTVTFYGHYDVQPATEPEWRTNPFELNAVNEHLYGRGTSDNKGPILAFIFAVREFMDACGCEGAGGGLPINIAFVFEGEEENGSSGFREAVNANLSWFEGTQLIVISNTNWVGENVPCLTYGMRGMISLSVQVSGPARDVHSGNDGGVFAEPMTDLVTVLGTLMEPGDTRVKVPGFYSHVAPGLVDLAWSSLQQHDAEFSRESYQAALGVPALSAKCASTTRELLEARWCRPCVSVVDVRPGGNGTSSTSDKSACYRFGPTRFSVIPATAVGKISLRFVPKQDPQHMIECLERHLKEQFNRLGSPNHLRVHVDALGHWWEADADSKWMRMAAGAIQREWGCAPLYVREGGTMPVASVLQQLLAAPAIMIPMGQASDAPHLANERIRRSNLIKGKGVIRALLEEVAGMWGPGAAGVLAEGASQQ